MHTGLQHTKLAPRTLGILGAKETGGSPPSPWAVAQMDHGSGYGIRARGLMPQQTACLAWSCPNVVVWQAPNHQSAATEATEPTEQRQKIAS